MSKRSWLAGKSLPAHNRATRSTAAVGHFQPLTLDATSACEKWLFQSSDRCDASASPRFRTPNSDPLLGSRKQQRQQTKFASISLTDSIRPQPFGRQIESEQIESDERLVRIKSSQQIRTKQQCDHTPIVHYQSLRAVSDALCSLLFVRKRQRTRE